MFLSVSAEDIVSRLKVSCRRCREFLEIEMFVDLSGYSYSTGQTAVKIQQGKNRNYG